MLTTAFTVMRKSLIRFLIFIYCVAQTGVLGWYYGKNLIHALSADWQSVRIAVQNKNADLSYLELDTATYRRKVKDDEISLNGTLYDITKTSISGKTIHLTLQKDEVETYFLKQYNQLTKWISKHHPSKQSEQYVMNWMMKLYFSCSCNIASDHLGKISMHRFVFDNRYFPSPYCEIPVKPPEQSIASLNWCRQN